MAAVQKSSVSWNRRHDCDLSDRALQAMAAGRAGHRELCLLYGDRDGREEESQVGHDDDSEDHLLYLVDRVFPVV